MNIELLKQTIGMSYQRMSPELFNEWKDAFRFYNENNRPLNMQCTGCYAKVLKYCIENYKLINYKPMEAIISINGINTESNEGKLLMAALAKITTESQTDKTPDEVLAQVTELANSMFVKPLSDGEVKFVKE